MGRFLLACLVAVAGSSALSFAQTELPSLHTETMSAPGSFDDLRRGTLALSFGSLDYRLVRRGMQADLRIGAVGAAVLIGYGGGTPRVELAQWRAYRGNVRFALDSHDGDGRYRIEYAREF